MSAIDTLPPLREVIASHGLSARKSLGQNFLLDLNLTAKIARQAGDMSACDVLEIGPGPGGLTRGLLAEGARHVCTGNPLRAQIMGAVPSVYTPPVDTINLLVVGGSLGARLISETVPKAVALLPRELRTRLRVVQQTREECLEGARRAYAEADVTATCETFFGDIETHLARAHFIIARAGASSVSEIAVMGKPSLFVPLKIAMDDHQTANASALKSLGAADILPESLFTPESVKTILEARLNDSIWLESASRAARSAAKPGAANALADLVEAAA